MELLKAKLVDHKELAKLNYDLMVAEKYDNILPIENLIKRMKTFLRTEYDAFWVVYNNSKVGYILIKRTSNPIYIRQFYIIPEFQRKGLGSETIRQIKKQYNVSILDVEVMIWNEVGFNFWKKIGFKPRCYSMRMTEL